jgi:hypothetical protein
MLDKISKTEIKCIQDMYISGKNIDELKKIFHRRTERIKEILDLNEISKSLKYMRTHPKLLTKPQQSKAKTIKWKELEQNNQSALSAVSEFLNQNSEVFVNIAKITVKQIKDSAELKKITPNHWLALQKMLECLRLVEVERPGCTALDEAKIIAFKNIKKLL